MRNYWRRFRAFKRVIASGILRFHRAPTWLIAASIAAITIQAPGRPGVPAGGELGADGERPDSWLVRKHRLLRRILVQTDCAFWCIHDHLDVLAYLGLPTLAVLLGSALALVGVWRTWDFPPVVDFLAAGVVFPFLALCIFTALPLPCAVFAWKAAHGETATVGECFAWCRRRDRPASAEF